MQSIAKTIVEGTMMKSRFFPKRDEIVLSMMTAVVVLGLVHLGVTSNGRVHAMFQKSVTVEKK